MSWSIDARIPLRLLSPIQLDSALRDAPATALLVEGDALASVASVAMPVVLQMAFAPGGAQHKAECSCCAGRGPVAEALDRMFQARIRGRCAWFDQVIGVVGTATARGEVLTALEHDPLTHARFRAV